MTGHRTPEAALEILARELFIQERTEPYGDPVDTRALWCDGISFSEQDVYRERARRLTEELGKSEIELTWRAP